jgi:glycosyltransferase involved in cell wall biosynthesis
VVPGIEDYGIFPVGAMSAGTPVLAYKAGGVLENLVEDVNGYYFTQWNRESFHASLKRVLNKRWDYRKVSESIKENNNTEETFVKKFRDAVS